MCQASGWTSSKLNPLGRVLGDRFKYVDPLVAAHERAEAKFTDPGTTPGTPGAVVPDAMFESPNARKRASNSVTGASLLGG